MVPPNDRSLAVAFSCCLQNSGIKVAFPSRTSARRQQVIGLRHERPPLCEGRFIAKVRPPAITVGGYQTMLEIDGFNSRFLGIHHFDGKPANENESTKAGTFLHLHKRALNADCDPATWRSASTTGQSSTGTATLTGSRSSPDWPVLHSDWLFLSAFHSEFEISAFTLETIKRQISG